MNTIRNTVKNIGALSASQFITAIISFFLMIYLARYLGEVGFGIYRFAISFVGLFSIFIDLGMNNYLIREIAREKKLTNTLVTNILLINVIFFLLLH